jgi:hypothetical protein
LPRSLLLVFSLVLLPAAVQELTLAWNWYAIQSAIHRLERWGGGGAPPAGVQIAVEMRPRPWVRLLGIQWGLRDGLKDWFPWLVDTPHVISVAFVGPRYDDAALTFATDQFAEVRQLRLEGCHVTQQGLRCLRAWEQLRGVELEGLRLSGEDLAALGEAPLLQTLEIRDCPSLGDAEVRQFPPLSRLNQLHLEIRGVRAAGLQGLAGLPSLNKLSLSDDQLTDQTLGGLPRIPELRLLSIRSTQLTGACLKQIGQLPALTVLEIDGSPIDDEGLEYLPRNNRLRGLFLVGSRIQGPGLAALDRLTALDDLSLAEAPLTDAGLEFLPFLPKLQAFNLSETAITGKAFPILRQRCAALKTVLVSLSNTLTPDDFVEYQGRGEGSWHFHTGWKSAREGERVERANPAHWVTPFPRWKSAREGERVEQSKAASEDR